MDTGKKCWSRRGVFYEQILQQAKGDPELRRELARIHRTMGQLARDTGGDGEPAFQRSVSLLEDLVREAPNNPDYRWELGQSRTWLSIGYQADLRLEEAMAERRKSHAIFVQLAAEFPSNEQYRDALAQSNTGVGRRLVGVGRFDEAEPYHRAAVQADSQLSAFTRIDSREEYAYLLMRLARYDEAQQLLEEAQQIAQREIAPTATPPHTNWALYLCYLAAWETTWPSCISIRASSQQPKSIFAWPSNPSPRGTPPLVVASGRTTSWGSSHHDLAELLTVMGRVAEAEQQRRQSLAAWESAGTPAIATFPLGKALAHYRLGELLHLTGRADRGRAPVRGGPDDHGGPRAPPARGINLPLAVDLPAGQLPG